ncbi:MAG: DNA cytosine methyltransferase [Syntrophales bacterium]|nr:DNA cytosine methyltransferase [Syntrophales bacterium]
MGWKPETLRKRRVIAVDLFAGAGGMSLGARWAGVDVRLAVEIDPHATRTYKTNHPGTKVLTKDIRSVKRIRTGKSSDTRILFGGPPCQGFSTSNQRTRNAENKQNWLYREFLRLVKQWKPQWVVFENVKGITETEGGLFLEKVQTELSSYGYTTALWVLNAADFGVPQCRSRVFVVGSSDGHEVPKPRCLLTPSRYITVKKALAGLPYLSNGASENRLPYRTATRSAYAKLMREDLSDCDNHLVSRNAPHVIQRYAHVPQGGNWEDIPLSLMENYRDRTRCHTGIYHRLSLKEPSVVIGNFRKNMLIHPEQDRGLSVREAARLQSFPDWYVFQGSIGFQQQQVGNSVPPLLAQAVFEAILRADSRPAENGAVRSDRLPHDGKTPGKRFQKRPSILTLSKKVD